MTTQQCIQTSSSAAAAESTALTTYIGTESNIEQHNTDHADQCESKDWHEILVNSQQTLHEYPVLQLLFQFLCVIGDVDAKLYNAFELLHMYMMHNVDDHLIDAFSTVIDLYEPSTEFLTLIDNKHMINLLKQICKGSNLILHDIHSVRRLLNSVRLQPSEVLEEVVAERAQGVQDLNSLTNVSLQAVSPQLEEARLEVQGTDFAVVQIPALMTFNEGCSAAVVPTNPDYNTKQLYKQDARHGSDYKYTEFGKQTTVVPSRGAAGQPREAEHRTLFFQIANTLSQRRPKHPQGRVKVRNTNRGLRSIEAVQVRRKARSLKRLIARRLARHLHSAKAPAGAQEPLDDIAQDIEINQVFRIATLNVKSMKRLGKREEIEYWMITKDIQAVILQETQIDSNSQERKRSVHWFFSGSPCISTQQRFVTGVGVVFAQAFMKYVKDVTPINDRCIKITLNSVVPITILGCYAPIAARMEEKDTFYDMIQQQIRQVGGKGPLFLLGDFNARPQTKLGPDEDCFGQYFFDRYNVKLTQQHPDTQDSRLRFVTLLCANELKAMNTFFSKPDYQLCTYHEIGNFDGPPWKRGRYETLDYVLAQQRWKNCVKNCQSDIYAGITTDHYPLIATFAINLKKMQSQAQKAQRKYKNMTIEENQKFNTEVSRTLGQEWTYQSLIQKSESMLAEIPQHLPQKHLEDITPQTLALLQQRSRMVDEAENIEKIKDINKQIHKQRRIEKREAALNMVRQDLDPRDRWAGLRRLKKQWVPNPYSLMNAQKKHVPRHDRAHVAALYLYETQWGQIRTAAVQLPIQHLAQQLPSVYNIEVISWAELNAALRRLKRRKSPGPDGVPMEFFKELDDIGRNRALAMFNSWWTTGQIPAEALRARVVLIYKKGDTGNPGNYRPISLLNSSYKVFTWILRERISAVLDPYLHPMQFGFRKERSTADALMAIRRLMDKGEATQTPVHLILLDWEKAFDKIYHDALFSSLERKKVHPHLIFLIKQVYHNPEFFVQIEGTESQWYLQRTGIRQGCPLSPYLFLVVMTCIMEDAHQEMDELLQHRVPGATFDEVLYADDTIIFSCHAGVLEKFLAAIEKHGRRYGLKLNYDKCEHMRFGSIQRIRFGHGVLVPLTSEAKYLGCHLNDEGSMKSELQRRMTQTMVVWKKLDLFWKHADGKIRDKLIAYNAIVGAKLLYGLEAAQINDSLINKMEVFHLRGLRQILKIPDHIYE